MIPTEEEVVRVAIELPPTVWDFTRDDSFVRLIVGPVGSGKSSGCCLEGAKLRAEAMPADKDGVRRSRGAIIRNTYPELRDTTIKTWNEWIRNMKMEGAYTWKQSEMMGVLSYELDDGTKVHVEVLFRALDRPDDIKKLLSLELTWAYINEWREVPKAVTDLLQTRVGRYPRKEDVPRYWTGIFGDSNAFDTDHYLYKLFFEPDPETGEMIEGHKVFVQPDGLSPEAENVEHLDACFDPRPEDLATYAADLGKTIHDPEVKAAYRVVQMKRIRGGEHEKPCRCYYRRMMKGKKQSWCDCYVRNKFIFAVDGKPIYDNFNQNVHVRAFDEGEPDYYSKLRQIYIGNDFGLTPAAVFAHVMPDGQIRISHEFVSQRMGAITFGKEQALLIKTTFPSNVKVQGWGDPAGNAGSSTDEDLTPILVVQGCGIPLVEAPTNEWSIRTGAVTTCLGNLTMTGEPEILVHPRCKTLIKALAGAYCLKRKQVSGDEQFRDVPDKNEWSHIAEAMQYLVVGLGRDRRVLDGGQDAPVGVQSPRSIRSVGNSAEDGPRAVQVSVIRSTSRR